MGKVYSHIAWRVSRNLNVENRAQKVLSQDKIRPPPKYKSNEEYLEKVRQELPELSAQLEKKDPDLLKRLENVYVTSKDPSLIDRTGPERRANLPLDRTPPELPTFGYTEPERVPYGRITLRAAIGFLAAHAQDPATHTAATIARRLKLDEQVTADILKHFKMMQMHAPDMDTGQVAQLEWTSEDPLSEKALQEHLANSTLPASLPTGPPAKPSPPPHSPP
ncbi:protein NDUFAF4 homolog [Pollicipes pollicipes]|uniref:protein NDUFAF4 homolog n=1 Tax=Pollicipes pollicipes TaxID=41117 RepID=UPI0018856FB9|nr:protein NDUFAF4 homolog [Pollicipes pollicipes]XP_037079810.1 protein NDUFAF4 homolog [Pollicipes pollicipes]